MSLPPPNAYDFPQFLHGLLGLSGEEIGKTVAGRIEDLEIRSLRVKGPTECRDVGMLKFLFELKEMAEILRGRGRGPVSTSRAELQIYRPLFEALVAQGEWSEERLEVLTERNEAGSYYENDYYHQVAPAPVVNPESPQIPPPLSGSARPQEPPPLPATRNPQEPPPLPARRNPPEPPPLPT